MADADANSTSETVLTRDAALLRDTVREAGALARSMFRTELKKWTKGASSPVSEADIAVNDLLEARLRAATPDYGWLSEESADDEVRLSRRLTWIVDPIDGTRNYLNGHDEWCVSVALVEDALPVLGAVFAPTSDEFFFAARGQGTTLNGKAVRATSGSDLDFSRVAGPKPLVERLKPSLGEIKLHPRIGFARAAALPGRPWRAGCGFCGRQQS
ncbi:fructose-1,6-bisphosphatase/inositol monophosphatase family enzyme [Bradyrhizobium sp. LM4.3]